MMALSVDFLQGRELHWVAGVNKRRETEVDTIDDNFGKDFGIEFIA